MDCSDKDCVIIVDSKSTDCGCGELVFSQTLCRADQSYVHAFGEHYLWNDFSVWDDTHQVLDDSILTVYRCNSPFGLQYVNPMITNDENLFVLKDNTIFGFK